MNLFKWWVDYRLERLRLKLEAQNKPFDAMVKVIEGQNQFVKSYFDGFKTTEIPSSTTIRDEDEFAREQEQRGELNPGVAASIRNALKAGAMPELKDILGIKDTDI